MALEFKEKRKLTKLVHAKVQELNGGGLSFKEKRTTTKMLIAAVEKLKGAVNKVASETLEKMLNGDFYKYTPVRFLAKMKKVVKELGGKVEPLKPPVLKYIDLNAKTSGDNGVMESLFAPFFEPEVP